MPPRYIQGTGSRFAISLPCGVNTVVSILMTGSVWNGISGGDSIPTSVLLAGMLRASDKVSDLIFSPGRPPQVEIHGQLVAVETRGSSALSADDTRRIAAD